MSKPSLASQVGMVSVPKHTPIPRLSIVVPIGRDLAAFECTLISVLENLPMDCEVLVAHDGSYDDPFDLCEEVRFVIADSAPLVDLVSAAAQEAGGRYIHVIADGLCATPGWVGAAVEKFEHFDAAVVAPIIRHRSTDKIVAAGWCDGRDRLCKPARAGHKRLETGSAQVVGAYLQASFWRREILLSLCESCSIWPSDEAAYAYEHLLRKAGWRCVLAPECDLLSDSPVLPGASTSMGRGQRLRAIRNHFAAGSGANTAAIRAVLGNLLRPKQIIEALGQATAPLAKNAIATQLQAARVPRLDDRNVIVMPNRSNDARRAA